MLIEKTKVFPDSHFGSFYPQDLVLDPQKLGARVLSNAHMINPKLYLFIYGFVFWCIAGLKGKNYQYFGSSFNLFQTTNPWILIKDPFTPHRKSLGPLFKSPEGKPWKTQISLHIHIVWSVISLLILMVGRVNTLVSVHKHAPWKF